MSLTIGKQVIRCNTCGKYFEATECEPDGHLFKCPNRHFSQFTVAVGLVINAVKVDGNPFIRLLTTRLSDALVQEELEWIRCQLGKLYDCGFCRTHGIMELPELPLGQMLKPSDSGKLEDDSGAIYTLIVSPNGISYYRKES